MHRCALVAKHKTRAHIVGECEMHKEKRDALEMRTIDETNMERISTLHNTKKTIAILRDRWWPQKAKEEGDKVNKTFM